MTDAGIASVPSRAAPGAVTAPCNLRGLGVLVTRPQAQADGLCRSIEAAGGRALRLPTVEIQAPTAPEVAAGLLAERWDLLIFISRNAVEGALALVDATHLAAVMQRAAVGKATAGAMADAGIPATLLPPSGYDSEALLALPALSRLAGKRVLIVRGEGGRALLGDRLAERGASVSFAEVYRRALPAIDAGAALRAWEDDLHLLTATSDEVLDNLLTLTPGSLQIQLKRLPLVVISERNAEHAASLGFEQVTAAGAGDAAMLAALGRLAESVERTGDRDRAST
jgi:uroporphyrinogen-III synthase